ncbi:glycosyltransferase [Pseudoduganella namucuonensis]|uniref:Alpha-1,6-mannosyltransferase n=1 Tax=Pseudoduganella namucuonensis TaxID=1035707 RepID=A0A1I7LXT2_9BURK|nr:glycosyltransferase [Pseudoduganella namucuonensis]SFV14491.1 alpha-1,6-mannosyltransferase [Pseudoduganella namucuonensis]
MHVVDVTMFYGGAGGGVSTYLDAKARWLAGRAPHRHTIASPNLPPHAGQVARAGPPHTAAIPGLALPGLNGYRLPRSTEAAARVLRALRPDLIEAGDAGPCAWAALRAGSLLRVPVVGFYHSDLPYLLKRRFGAAAEGLARGYVQRLYSRVDLLLAPSAAMVRRLAGMGLRAAQQPLGIDTAVFHPRRRDGALRAQLGLPESARLLVYAGRFSALKRLDLLHAAIRRLGDPYHLLMVGGPRARRHGRVTQLPYQDNPRELARLLASCDALVHPGDSETFGLIVLEAMACGLPVVVTSGGAVAELVEPGTGVVVAPNSVERLCEGVDLLFARDPAALGGNAWRAVCPRHDWNRVLPLLLDHYDTLLAERRVYVQR